MNAVQTAIDSPLGRVMLKCHAPTLSVIECEFQPLLPRGMHVAKCHGVLFRMGQLLPGSRAQVQISVEPSSLVSGGPETGEGLEAAVWRSASHVLAVGTEDEEFLRQRLGNSEIRAVFEYRDGAMLISLDPLQNCKELNLHIVLAWNGLPEPAPESCWYAVDQRHGFVVSQVAPA